jgi:hypothetical protein
VSRLDSDDLDLSMMMVTTTMTMNSLLVDFLLLVHELLETTLLDEFEHLLLTFDSLDGLHQGLLGLLQVPLAFSQLPLDFLLLMSLGELQAPSEMFEFALLMDNDLLLHLDNLATDDDLFLLQPSESALEMLGVFVLLLQGDDLPLELVDSGCQDLLSLDVDLDHYPSLHCLGLHQQQLVLQLLDPLAYGLLSLLQHSHTLLPLSLS